MKPLLSVLFALLLLAPASAHARILTVDPSGGGDFTTIQGAIDAVQRWFGPPDTIVVNAGTYPEHLLLPHTDTRPLITCPAGAAATSVLGMTFAACTPSGSGNAHWIIRDLTVVERCIQGAALCLAQWQRCVFRGGYEGNFGEWGVPVSLSDCDFFDSVKLLGVRGPMRDLRFHSAPLTTEPRVGGLTYQRCRFTGEPGDTLVHAPRTEDLSFYSCVFDSAAVGIWAPNGGYGNFTIDSCRFTLVSQAVAGAPMPSWLTIAIRYSRFEECTRAVVWPGGNLYMTSDTLSGCGNGAVAATSSIALIFSPVVQGNVGDAFDLVMAPDGNGYAGLGVTNGVFRNVTGLALRIREHTPPPRDEASVRVSDSRFENCGRGVEIASQRVELLRNVFFANSGTACVYSPTQSSTYGSHYELISENTFAANLGHGIEVVPGPLGIPSVLSVTRNVSTNNGGDGIRFGAAFAGTLANNDSWHNLGTDYSGVTPGPTNLSVDPRFCDMPNGVLTLAEGSPCAPAAITGPMGALGVGCTVPVAGVVPSAGAIAFAVHPNPARGSVEFSLPPGTRDGRLEVLDVQGRRVWGQTVAPGVAGVRWSGQLERGGSADAGLYWARCTSAAGVSTRRLVWLR